MHIARFFSDRRRTAAVVVGLIAVIGAGIGAVFLTSPGSTERPFVKASRSAPSPAPVTTSTIAAPTVPAADPVPSPSAPPADLTNQQSGANQQSGGPPPSAVAAEVIIVCETPVIDENGYETSSSYAYRAPAGTQPPPGCHLG